MNSDLRHAGPLPLSARARRTGEQPISSLIAAAIANPELVNLAAGLVDPRTLPVEEVGEISRVIFSDAGRGQAALQYDTTLGLAPLRSTLLRHMEKLEGVSAARMGLSEHDLLITTGSQQALFLIADCMIDPGDLVITVNPCYFVFAGTLASLGATVLPVGMDEQGMDVEAVALLIDRLRREGRLHRLKFIYVTSYFQNPTGLTLSTERRRRLLEIVRRAALEHRILILEDAAYRELRYDGLELPSIKSMDHENRYTILTQTFSKPFAPGLKTGYTAMPADLANAVLDQKGNHDFGSSSLAQHIALEAMQSGMYAKHVARLRESYRAKRDEMLVALQRHMPKEITEGNSLLPSPGVSGKGKIHWTHPTGGLYTWVTLPPTIDTSRNGPLFARALKHGVLYVPGDYCFHPEQPGQPAPRHHLRLSFGQVDPRKIETGIARLARAVVEEMEASAVSAA